MSGVRQDMYVVRGDCSSATLPMQFKLLAPQPVVKNSILTCCHLRMSSALPPCFPQLLYFFINSGHLVSNARKYKRLNKKT